jgi:hypothetical protein
MAGKKTVLPVYDFDHPIRITRYRPAGLDIVFYTVALGIVGIAMILLLFWRNGKLVYEFTLGRTLLSFPLAMIAVVLFGLLRELRTYTAKLLKKSVWTIEELMEMTGKGRKETEQIISHVLESCFTVDLNCLLNAEELGLKREENSK